MTERNWTDNYPSLPDPELPRSSSQHSVMRHQFLLGMATIAVVALLPIQVAAAERITGPIYRISVPKTVLTDVPVKLVRIERLNREGKVDRTFNSVADDANEAAEEKRNTRPLITGVLLTQRDRTSGKDIEKSIYSQGGFRDGVLEVRTTLGESEEPFKVYINADEIVVDPESRAEREALSVRRINRWWSILPPLLAIVLAVVLRNVLIALFAAIWSGAFILSNWNIFAGFARTMDLFLIGEVGKSSDTGSYDHLLIILFTMFLGAMIGVMGRSGGTAAIVQTLGRYAKTREHGQLLTWMLGFAVFFDDYANTLLVGSTMRPVTDRLKISREKLAFIVDSTAAPVAGLAIVSTWVGVEVGLIQSSYEQLFANTEVEWNAYSVFLATIPFRFYPLLLLMFVMLVAYSGNDFGPMLRAEARAQRYGELGNTDTDDTEPAAAVGEKQLLRNAVIPLIVLMTVIVGGLWKTGTAGLNAHNESVRADNQAANGTTTSVKKKDEEPATLTNILKHSDSTRVMFFAAFLASISGVLTAIIFRCLTLNDAVEAWISGAKSMFAAVIILVMAWTVATICDSDHLNTAGFFVELAGGRVSVAWVPAMAFLLSAVVSLATGSSFATMGLLMPLFINMTYFLLVNENDANPTHHLLLGAIGAVLAGSIFGDHCSPISDTTVLSSAATGCDHLRHVATQLPYAVVVGGVSLALGYIPVGMGISPLITLPLGMIVLYLVVLFIGHPTAEFAKALPDKPETAKRTKNTVDLPSVEPNDDSAPPPQKTESDAAKERVEQANIDDIDVDWDSLPE